MDEQNGSIGFTVGARAFAEYQFFILAILRSSTFGSLWKPLDWSLGYRHGEVQSVVGSESRGVLRVCDAGRVRVGDRRACESGPRSKSEPRCAERRPCTHLIFEVCRCVLSRQRRTRYIRLYASGPALRTRIAC